MSVGVVLLLRDALERLPSAGLGSSYHLFSVKHYNNKARKTPLLSKTDSNTQIKSLRKCKYRVYCFLEESVNLFKDIKIIFNSNIIKVITTTT